MNSIVRFSLILLLISQSFILGFSQNHSDNDLDYYYLFDNQLIDVRDNSIIAKDVPHGVVEPTDDGGFLIIGLNGYNSGAKIHRFDCNHKRIYQVALDGQISPDRDYLLRVINGDIYIQNLNLENGSVTKPKQVTQLAIFSNNFDFYHWWKDFVIFPSYNKPYRLNVRTGEI